MVDTFSYPRGAPIYLDIVIAAPSPIDLTTSSVSMVLKPTLDAGGLPLQRSATVATFDVVYHPANGTEAAYWRGTISAAVSATLTTRKYATTAWISVGGQVIQATDPIYIVIYESISS
jgi:hypothetical protein